MPFPQPEKNRHEALFSAYAGAAAFHFLTWVGEALGVEFKDQPLRLLILFLVSGMVAWETYRYLMRRRD